MSPTDEEIGELAAKLRGEAGASMFKNTRHEAAGYLESLLARAKAAEIARDMARDQFDNHVIWASGEAQGIESDLSTAREEIAELRNALEPLLVAHAGFMISGRSQSDAYDWFVKVPVGRWDSARDALRSSRTKGE